MPGDIVRYPYKRRVETSPGHYRQVSGHKRIKIPPGHCWVEGDSSIYANANGNALSEESPTTSSSSNKSSSRRRKGEAAHLDLSRDSRHFGPIPLALLTAKVSLIFYPLSRLGPIPDRPGQGPTNLGATGAAVEGGSGKPVPRASWWPFAGGSDAGRGANAGPEEEGWWKRAEDDSRLTPYADEESQAGSAEVGRQRVRFMDSGAAAAESLHPHESLHGLGRGGDEAQTVPISWALFSRRARSGESMSPKSDRGSDTETIPPLLRAPHHHPQERIPPTSSPSPLGEDGAALVVEPKRRALYKQRHASDLSAEEVERRRVRLNAMSRGGKLGDSQLEEEQEQGQEQAEGR